MHPQLTDLRPLTESERLDARDRARAMVLRKIGTEPQLAEFHRLQIREYPDWLYRVMYLLMAVVLLSGGWWSASRLISIGHQHYLETVNNPTLATIGGVAMFAMAEALLMVSLLALNMLGISGYARLALGATVGLGLAVALVGNYVIVEPHSLFAWLETITPPVTVVSLTLVGEKIALQKAKEAQQVKREYRAAYEAWKANSARPEASEYWQATLANVYKEALMDANSRGMGSTTRKQTLAALGVKEWQWLVARELHADSWGENLAATDYSDLEAAPRGNGHKPANPTELALMPAVYSNSGAEIG